jgi:hypothetical protein
MHVGTWPTGLVFRFTGGAWVSQGRLGEETEVMNLYAFGGALYAGSLPEARVFRMDARGAWTDVGRLDQTPNVLYRRAASMAVHRGELVVGTLPSGRVKAMRVGIAVLERAFDRARSPSRRDRPPRQGARALRRWTSHGDRTDVAKNRWTSAGSHRS